MLNKSFINKKILILGGNKETANFVEYAKKIGFYIIVVDPNIESPAKKIANESFEFDGFDINGIVSLVKLKKIDAVMVGVADILVKPYYEITKQLGFYCYANQESSVYLTNKSKFRELCINNGVNVTPYYSLENAHKIDSSCFPLLIKPSDNGAGVGIYISHDSSDLFQMINQALLKSNSKTILIEKYMNADDIFAYYSIQNGEVILSAIADRITYKDQRNKSPVCAIAMYPSKHTSDFIRNMNDKIKRMIQNLKIDNGILMIQFFFLDSKFYAYDPGFRLQGEGPDVYLHNLQGIDHKKYLLDFSLTGKFGPSNLSKIIDPFFNGQRAYTLWILLDVGIIDKIYGLSNIQSRTEVIHILTRFDFSDSVTEEMIGTERQVFARIYSVVKNKHQIIDLINFIRLNLRVLDLEGRNLVINTFDLSISAVNHDK